MWSRHLSKNNLGKSPANVNPVDDQFRWCIFTPSTRRCPAETSVQGRADLQTDTRRMNSHSLNSSWRLGIPRWKRRQDERRDTRKRQRDSTWIIKFSFLVINLSNCHDKSNGEACPGNSHTPTRPDPIRSESDQVKWERKTNRGAARRHRNRKEEKLEQQSGRKAGEAKIIWLGKQFASIYAHSNQ